MAWQEKNGESKGFGGFSGPWYKVRSFESNEVFRKDLEFHPRPELQPNPHGSDKLSRAFCHNRNFCSPLPKSAILTLSLSSRRRFSGLRSRCTTLCRWQYSTPDMICWKNLRARFSVNCNKNNKVHWDFESVLISHFDLNTSRAPSTDYLAQELAKSFTLNSAEPG